MSAPHLEANELFANLRADIGEYPHWSANTIAEFLWAGTSEASIRAEYRIVVNAYNEYKVRARELFSRMHRDFGERSNFDESTVLELMDGGNTEEDIIRIYKNHKRSDYVTQSAGAILYQLQREFGPCDTVTKEVIRRWSTSLSYRDLVLKYKSRLDTMRRLQRVQTLRKRYQEEAGDELEMSDKDLLKYFKAGWSNDKISEIIQAIRSAQASGA